MRADHAQEVAQRCDAVAIRTLWVIALGHCQCGAPSFCAGQARIGRAAQGNAVIRVKRNKHHAQHPRPLRLGLAVLVEGIDGRNLGKWCARRLARFPRRWLVNAPCHGLQQLAGVVKIAPPQQGSACAGQVVCVIRRGGVVGQNHALWGCGTALGAPQGVA